jgi:hypothetical protein
MQEPSFAESLLECDDPSSLKSTAGNRFIRKLPDNRSLGYLHKLYTPLDCAGCQQLRDALGRDLSPEFESFLRWSNGANLFDDQIYLFGLVGTFSRDTALENQQPISIVDRNSIHSAVTSARWHDGWIQIGSVVGWSSTYGIELHKGGACALTSEDGVYATPSFERCVTVIIDRISACFSCDGVIDSSYAEIEAALRSLFRSQ